MKVRTREATGVLAELLANIDENELAKVRKRMMLAAKIETAMKRCGYNQAKFARVMKKSPTVISEWLSGDRNFTIDTLIDIEDALGIRLLDISIMAIVNAGIEISQRFAINSEKVVIMNYENSWDNHENYKDSKHEINCA